MTTPRSIENRFALTRLRCIAQVENLRYGRLQVCVTCPELEPRAKSNALPGPNRSANVGQACSLALLALALLAAPAFAAAPHQPAASADGFVSLFNGRDLTGWLTGPDNAWGVEDGVITLRREMDGQEHNADYLWTKETYANFVLELECKIPDRANSGIFLRTSDLKDPVYSGMEIQVANSYGRDTLSRTGTAGAVYDCLAPTRNPLREPGQWNQFRITCRNNLVRVELNGEQILEMNLDQWTEPRRNPDGSSNKFPKPLKEFARKGHVGLQDHGRPVWYRNIKIKKLED